jgi:mannonate dehydratase
VFGNGDGGTGLWFNPAMEAVWRPQQYVQRLFYLNAGCAHDAPGRVDAALIERMHNMLDGMRDGCKLVLLAFDAHYDKRGLRDLARTAFITPNDYAMLTAQQHPKYFEWAASIHPYRADSVSELERCAAAGARAVKWLPAAQGMDPGSPLCDRFYAALARFDLPLLVHAGQERAVHGGDTQRLGNPLRLRRPLEHGVRVIVAHCASLGQDRDLDAGEDGPWIDNFTLFSRLMDETRDSGRLYGDISAVTQRNRAGPVLQRLLERSDWHPRLLNGSDYPLPGVMPLFSVDYMAELGLLERADAPVLSEIRRHNPLLFDFVLKRRLRWQGKGFAADIFETRAFFDNRAPTDKATT